MAQDLKLNVSISGDFKSLERSLKSLQTNIRKTATGFDNVGKSLNKVGRRLSLFVTGPLAAIGVASVRAFDKQQQAIAQVEQGLISTGNAAGFTSEELQKLASSIQSNSLFGDEDILQGVTAQILTFTNIAGEQFERTQQAAIDLSARLGVDLQSSAIQLGKALNDPVANLSALSRSGIQFSKEQKEVINSLVETNRLADAQTIILNELEKQYGGSAAAAAAAGLGPFKQFQNSLGDLSEDIGEIFTPAVNSIAKSLSGLINSFKALTPETRRFVVLFGVVAASIGPALIALGTFSRIIGFSIIGLQNITGVIKNLATAFIRLGIAIVSNPIVLILAGVGVVLAEIIGRVSQLRSIGLSIGDSLKVVALDFLIFTQGLLEQGNKFISGIANTISSTIESLSQGAISLGTFDFAEDNRQNIQALEIEKQKILDAAQITPEDQEKLKSGFGAGLSVVVDGVKDTLSGAVDTVKKSVVDLGNSAADSLNLALPSIKKTKEEGEKAKKETSEIVTLLKESGPQQAASGLANAFGAIADGSKNAKNAFSDFASSFLQQISRMIVESLLLNSIKSAFSIGTDTGSPSPSPNATGGLIGSGGTTRRFAEGGMVNGPGTGTSDSIPARLSDGEFVSDARTVGFFGPSFFQNLKRISRGQFQMPAFNQGGFVSMASGSEVLSRNGGGVGTIEVKNSGSPKEATRTLTRDEAQGTVTTIFLEDLERNGPISRGLSRKNRGPSR